MPGLRRGSNSYKHKPRVLTFDFQNDGELGRTFQQTVAHYGYTAGQGFWQYSSGGSYGQEIKMPASSLVPGKLVKAKIWGTRPNNKSSIGISGLYISGYGQDLIRIGTMGSSELEAIVGNTHTFPGVISQTGEITGEFQLDDDGKITWSAAGGSGEFTNLELVTKLRTHYNNGNFCCHFTSWSGNATMYIRKLQLTII